MQTLQDYINCGKRALEMRKEKYTREQVAKELGISKHCVIQMIDKAISYDRYPAWTKGLSVRAANAMRAEDLTTIGEAKEAIASGRLKLTPNLGKVSLKEVIRLVNGAGNEAK